MPISQLICHSEQNFSVENMPARHVLWLLPEVVDLPLDLPAHALWQAVLARQEVKLADLLKEPRAIDLPDGCRMVLVSVSAAQSVFARQTVLREAVMLLLDESPAKLAIVANGTAVLGVADAVYVALCNGAPLPQKKKEPAKPLQELAVFCALTEKELAVVARLAAANVLTRSLTALPPNELGPREYRGKVRELALQHGWDCHEYALDALQTMGAGAFCAVAQGSSHRDAAIVHLSYRPASYQPTDRKVALVGKGICFDTGGHNLKPAKYMQGMHDDMNGSAVVLGLLQMLTQSGFPLPVDAWLAISHNHISATAYSQNDVLTALNGTTIEVVHTDAEGRLVLADTLTLAAREKPSLMVDFATLTGSMVTALGTRYCGVFATSEALAAVAVKSGAESGERVCLFPLAEDYDEELDSEVADVKQCTMDGDADHILATLFLKRFTADVPWLHVDLSAVKNEGGLGAIATELTGFGVAWGWHFLQSWLDQASE